jgi:hypothetical protein
MTLTSQTPAKTLQGAREGPQERFGGPGHTP